MVSAARVADGSVRRNPDTWLNTPRWGPVSVIRLMFPKRFRDEAHNDERDNARPDDYQHFLLSARARPHEVATIGYCSLI